MAFAFWKRLLEAERRTEDSPPSTPTAEDRLKMGCCGRPTDAAETERAC